MIDHLDFVGDLCTAENDNKRPFGCLKFVAEKLQFALHQQTGCALTAASGDDAGHTGSGGVCTMGGTESVIREHVSIAGELPGEIRVVGLFLGVVADILQ